MWKLRFNQADELVARFRGLNHIRRPRRTCRASSMAARDTRLADSVRDREVAVNVAELTEFHGAPSPDNERGRDRSA